MNHHDQNPMPSKKYDRHGTRILKIFYDYQRLTRNTHSFDILECKLERQIIG
jgi:hypothetical protein